MLDMAKARTIAAVIPLGALVILASGCQDYPFAFRRTEHVEAERLDQLVATLTPVDILFMIDTSGTMKDETDELKNNVERFVTELIDQEIDFQMGLVTADVECNMPNRVCSGTDAWSYSCCAQGRPLCTEKDNNGDGVIETSDCEVGRLQGASASGTRIFKPPTEADKAEFVQDFIAAIDFAGHNLKGSAFESGIQSVALTVACSIGSPDCDDASTGNALAAKQLDSGFIRDNADLVIIFMSDEDDCSTGDPSVYRAPNNSSSPADTASHFCSPDECYAYYNAGQDADHDGLDDWSDPTNPGLANRLTCGSSGGVNRTVNPPGLRDVGQFLDKLAAYKGDLHKVRAAGIVSAVQLTETSSFQAAACYPAAGGPSAECGCTSGSSDFSCYVTGANDQGEDRQPTRSATDGGPIDHLSSGCLTAPGRRYVEFLADLQDRHVTAGFAADVLIDSICRTAYDTTLDEIVNNIIISKCFQLSAAPSSPDYLTVTLNGEVLPNVPVGSSQQGWSLSVGSKEICLEGGLTKHVGDRFQILQVTDTQ